MNRVVQYLNFFGVLLLAGLCVTQWRHNRDLHLEVNRLERKCVDADQKSLEQEKNIRGLTSDLAVLKEQFSQTHSNWQEAKVNFRNKDTENNQLLREQAQLKESVTNWAKAVTQRDERIKSDADRISDLETRLADSIHKFNALATNYNSVAKQLEEARSQLGAQTGKEGQPSK